MIREFVTSREFIWTLLGALIGLGINRLGLLAGST